MDQNQDSVWIDEQTQDSPFEQRVAQPEVFEAEYTERRTDEDGSQSDTKGLLSRYRRRLSAVPALFIVGAV